MSIGEQIQNALSELPPAQQERVLEFVRSLKNELADDDKAIGEAGVKLMGDILEPEDFSDWETARS